MTCREVWLVLSLAVIFYNKIAIGSDGISLKIQIPNKYPITTLNIGPASSQKEYKVVLGTWTEGIWLFSKKACESDEKKKVEMCKKINPYDDSTLSEDRIKNKDVSLPYLKKELTGYIIEETINIGDQSIKRDILIATTWDSAISDENKDGHYDGYFGIRFMPKNEKGELQESPFLLALHSNNKITNKVFGIYLNYAENTGELMLGGINSQYIQGGETALKNVPLESNGLNGWLINIQSIKVGSTEVGQNIKVYVDPSTYYVQGKREIITAINDKLGADMKFIDVFLLQCNKKTNEEIQLITHNGVTLKPDPSATFEELPRHRGFQSLCLSTFGINDDIQDYDLIIGSTLLSQYYSVFDIENKQLRFTDVANPKT